MSTVISHAVSEKLAKLIPLLASDKVGEVAATAAAIDRTLSGAGLDWHDLAEAIAGKFIIRDAPQTGGQAPACESQLRTDLRDRDREIARLRKAIADRNEAEKAERPLRWRWLTTVERVAWLDSIADAEWLSEVDRAYVARLRTRLWSHPHIGAEKGDAVRFNRLVGIASERLREVAA